MGVPISDAFLGRIQHEKAQLPNEGVTLSQLTAGRNMTIVRKPNGDLQFNAAGAGIGGGAGVGQRMMTGEVTFTNGVSPSYWSDVFPMDAAGILQIGMFDKARGSAADRSNFSTVLFADINHNWNLTDAWGWVLTLTDSRAAPKCSFNSIYKVVAVNNNVIRIYAGWLGTAALPGSAGYDVNPITANCTYTFGSYTVTPASTNLLSDIFPGMMVEASTLVGGRSLITAVGASNFTITNKAGNSGSDVASTFRLFSCGSDTHNGYSPKQNYIPTMPRFKFTVEEYV